MWIGGGCGRPAFDHFVARRIDCHEEISSFQHLVEPFGFHIHSQIFHAFAG